MTRNEALMLLENLDKLRHYAMGGRLMFPLNGKLFSSSLPNLRLFDKYVIFKEPKPKYKYVGNADIWERVK